MKVVYVCSRRSHVCLRYTLAISRTKLANKTRIAELIEIKQICITSPANLFCKIDIPKKKKENNIYNYVYHVNVGYTKSGYGKGWKMYEYNIT